MARVSNVLHFPRLKNPFNKGFHALRVSPCLFRWCLTGYIYCILVCGASRRNGEWVVNTVQNQVVNTGHVVNHVVNSERSESTLRGVRGAPGAHSRRVTTDRPPITRRRRAPRPEQTTPRPGPLLRATAEHISGPQNVFAAEERPELRRSPAEMHRTE